MRRALELAEARRGTCLAQTRWSARSSSRMDRIIGEGWHEHIGGLHAERNALKNCTEDPYGRDNLRHAGAMLPLGTHAAMYRGDSWRHKLSRVVVGCLDPNPLVAGKGIAHSARRRHLSVRPVCWRTSASRVNEVFFHYITTKKPFVVMKYAMTLDGPHCGVRPAIPNG